MVYLKKNLLIGWTTAINKISNYIYYYNSIKNVGKILIKNLNTYYDSSKVKSILKLNDEEYELMILNLYWLKVYDSLKSSGNEIVSGDLSAFADAEIKKFRLTVIGYRLLESLSE